MSARYQVIATGGVYDFETRAIVLPNGAAWPEYQAWLTQGGTPLAPDAIGQDDLATAKAKRCAEINSYAAGLRNKAISGRSSGEMASWTIKLMDALVITAAQASPWGPLLAPLGTALGLQAMPRSINDALGQVRGISEAAHAAKVIAQAVPFMVVEIAVDALRGKHCDAINAMTDVRDIMAYNWMAGWPALP